jgi:hypothetical protein
MKRISTIGLCLVAALALSAVLASVASAETEPYYTTLSKTKVEEVNTLKIAFTNEGLKRSKLEGAVVIECEHDKGKGDIEGPKKSVKVKLEYKECESPAISASCQKAPTKPGIIITNPLKGELGYASEKSGGTPMIAEELQPETKPEFAKFTCGPKKELSVSVTGVIFARPSPVNAPPVLTGEVNTAEKAVETEFGCGKQQFLYLGGGGPCLHLSTQAGVVWNVAEDKVTLKVHPIGIKG